MPAEAALGSHCSCEQAEGLVKVDVVASVPGLSNDNCLSGLQTGSTSRQAVP